MIKKRIFEEEVSEKVRLRNLFLKQYSNLKMEKQSSSGVYVITFSHKKKLSNGKRKHD